jgi:hypothetical protein
MFSANGLEVGIHQYFSACPGGIHGVRPSAKNYCALWHLRAAHGFSPGDPTVDFVIRLRPQKFRVGRDFWYLHPVGAHVRRGLRVSELCSINLSDINLETKEFHVNRLKGATAVRTSSTTERDRLCVPGWPNARR